MVRSEELELRSALDHLTSWPRSSASDGERRAAEWIAERLTELGCVATVEEERAYGAYWWSLAALSGLGAVSALVALRGRRLLGLIGGAVAAAGLVDEATAGPYVFRRLFLRRRPTWNVVSEAGDRDGAQTLVVLAHHDAAHSGLLFHPAVPKWLYEHFPERVEKTDESLPYWLPVVAAPALVAAGALIGRALGRAVTRAGLALAAINAAMALDIARRGVVPGANDNLSGVAVLLSVARRLREEPVKGVRVLLVSCGSEESLQEGILALAARHFDELPRDTRFLVVDTVGSPELLMIEAEGTLVVRDYSPEWNELIASVAAEQRISLRRGARLRASTDACIPRRHGFRTALLGSINKYKAASNYHWPTDTAENVDYGTVTSCAALTDAVIRRLARTG